MGAALSCQPASCRSEAANMRVGAESSHSITPWAGQRGWESRAGVCGTQACSTAASCRAACRQARVAHCVIRRACGCARVPWMPSPVALVGTSRSCVPRSTAAAALLRASIGAGVRALALSRCVRPSCGVL
jgi:hypothetical protein